jgi:hypothetical protein
MGEGGARQTQLRRLVWTLGGSVTPLAGVTTVIMPDESQD